MKKERNRNFSLTSFDIDAILRRYLLVTQFDCDAISDAIRQ